MTRSSPAGADAPRRGGLDLPRFLLVRYAGAALVLVAVVSTTFYVIVRRGVLYVWENHSVSVANHLGAELTMAGVRLPPEKGQLATLDRLARRHMDDLRIAKINVIDGDGEVVYSTDTPIIGRRMRGNAKLEAALRGRPASSLELAGEHRDLPADSHGGDTLETYVPIRREGRIVGSFEIYQRVDDLYARLRTFRGIVLAGSAAIALALGAVALAIARRAGRLLGAERAVRHRYEQRLEGLAAELESEVERRTVELRQERDRLRAVTDHVPSAFVLLDAERRIQLATRSFQDLTGIAPDAVVGRRCTDVVGHRVGCTECLAARVLDTGVAQQAERLVQTPEGRSRWIEQWVLPVHGAPEGGAFLEVFSDVTERKRMEEGLVRSAKMVALGEMATVVAHEVRNSLNSIKLLLQVMSDEPERPPGAEPLAVALGSVGRGERLVANLLRFARPQPPKPLRADGASVAREVAALMRPQFDRAQVDLALETDGATGAVFDPDQVREALVNLLLNAVQASAAGKRVIIAVETAPAPANLAGADGTIGEGAAMLRFTVRDAGRGMSGEDAARAFDPFFTTRVDGTGLGLPTVRRIAFDHAGAVTLASEPGHGTTVALWLPCGEEAPGA